MERVIQVTADGSPTIAIPGMHITYHSIFGAVQESRHVFIAAGLNPLLQQHETIRIFEMGFGTGLNALLSLQQAIDHHQKIYYYAVELFPLNQDEYKLLHYAPVLRDDRLQPFFMNTHTCAWEKDVSVHPLFILHKTNLSLLDLPPVKDFHLVYYDAFAPATQPELWTKEIFEKMFNLLADKGILVTYCSKGDVRRAMLSAGFTVEKLPGPKGKREMLRAAKIKI